MRHFIALLLFAFALTGCTTPTACTTPPPAPPARVPVPPPAGQLKRAEVLSYISARPSGVKFVSHNGHMYGTDCDAEITLAKDNQIKVIEYGYTMNTYHGTYSVDASGVIHVSLRDYRMRWPSMYLCRDKRGTFLYPTDVEQSFLTGGSAGAVITPEIGGYWPFRRVK